ncbi:MAG TPA: trypsin-like peptidase domain-containing protein [Pirellulaceae bacterium]|nr:trypsin-like peptidase domain-containing protein [Pirellulaceae bacterium]
MAKQSGSSGKRRYRGDEEGYRGASPRGKGVAAKRDGAAESSSVGNDEEMAAEAMTPEADVGELEFDVVTTAAERAQPHPEFDESLALDAWYASYASRASQAMAKTERRRGIVAEMVLGPDGRVQITDTENYPWRAICSLRISARDGSSWIGTGWFIAKRVIITAGHCVYIHDRGGWVRSVEVIPGRDASEFPYGSRKSTRFRSTAGWVNGKKPPFDYGAILLSENQEFDPYPGNLLYSVLSNSELTGQRVNVAGYPGDKPTGTMWWHHDKISSIDATTISYLTDTAGGQSGAAAFLKNGDERIAVGIHNYGASTGNSATRIANSVVANFDLWKTQA